MVLFWYFKQHFKFFIRILQADWDFGERQYEETLVLKEKKHTQLTTFDKERKSNGRYY